MQALNVKPYTQVTQHVEYLLKYECIQSPQYKCHILPIHDLVQFNKTYKIYF